jgi:hypothetical protein
MRTPHALKLIPIVPPNQFRSERVQDHPGIVSELLLFGFRVNYFKRFCDDIEGTGGASQSPNANKNAAVKAGIDFVPDSTHAMTSGT